VERIANIDLAAWRNGAASRARSGQLSVGIFAAILLSCACLSALLASWLPLQVSLVTVFLFAGPHNWFELRYFLSRLPVRFGKSRNFFLTAFAGIAFLTLTYISLPVLNSFIFLPDHLWPTILASWNTLLLLWLGILVWLRGKNKLRRDWSWSIPVALALCSLNWRAPEFFSLGIVYLHPLVALWFLDRHLSRNRPEWLRTYRLCLCLVPLLLAGMFWQLSRAPALADDNGLFWRITQHAGAQLLPNVSSRMLVATHVFLEVLHYGVWLVALPLIAPLAKPVAALSRRQEQSADGIPQPLHHVSPRLGPAAFWNLKTVPLARHPRGFPKLVATALAFAVFLVALLWFGFAVDYATTRDIYFTVAIAHVLAEAPFLLKML
jgi:hypothetical protein